MATTFAHNAPSTIHWTAFRAAMGKLGPEDALTHIVALELAQNPAIAREWAGFLLSNVSSRGNIFDDEPIKMSVQPYSGNDQPDMAITVGQTARLVFEHKLGAPEGANQLERYIRLCESEERQTKIPHFLAFVAPSQRNLLASHYNCERFITIDGRHPEWSDLGAIIETRVEEQPAIKPLYDLFDELNLLPYEIPADLEPLLEEARTLADLPREAIKARRGFNMMVRTAGQSAIDRGWTASTGSMRSCFFEPPERIRTQQPLLRWMMFEVWPHRRVVSGVRMPAPSLFANISFFDSRDMNAKMEIEALTRHFQNWELCGYRPTIAATKDNRANCKVRIFWMFFDLNKIWENGDFETVIERLVPYLTDLFDPPIATAKETECE